MYEEFKSVTSGVVDTSSISREDKLALMKDVFSLEYGQQFATNEQVFPAFYAQDLIVFGIENNIVEAVRLGEKMMSDNGYILSTEMQKAVKQYLINNAESYQRAIKRTGPIDNTSLYRKVQSKRDQDAAPVMFTLDDPYWQAFIENNSRRTQQWRVPSHLAWNHKQFGIVGEVIDVKQVIEAQKRIRHYMV